MKIRSTLVVLRNIFCEIATFPYSVSCQRIASLTCALEYALHDIATECFGYSPHVILIIGSIALPALLLVSSIWIEQTADLEESVDSSDEMQSTTTDSSDLMTTDIGEESEGEVQPAEEFVVNYNQKSKKWSAK